LLNGSPLISYTIRAAQKATELSKWVVSTEDEQIESVALSLGSQVLKRPEELAEDHVTSGEVCLHVLNEMERLEGCARYDMVVLLHPTSPIRDPKHIDDAIQKVARSGLDTLASVVNLPRKTHNNIKCITDGRLLVDASTQCPYMLNGSIYVMKVDWLRRNSKHTHHCSEFLLMDRYHSIDIDEPIDLKIAELYLNANPN